MSYVALALRLALAGVFIVSGIAKLRALLDTVEMWRSLLRQARFPQPLAVPASWALIAVEALTGVALLIGGPVSLPALAVAGLMLLAFTGLAVISARSDLDLRCACFGRATARLGWRHVWRNLVLLAIGVAGIVVHMEAVPIAAEIGGIVVAASVAVVVTMLAAFYDDIVDLVVDLLLNSARLTPSDRSYPLCLS